MVHADGLDHMASVFKMQTPNAGAHLLLEAGAT